MGLTGAEWEWVLGGTSIAGIMAHSLWRNSHEAAIQPIVHTEANGHRTPRGPEWRAQHLPMQWPNTEAGRRSFVRYMVRKLLDLDLLDAKAAPLFVAHSARETGYGQSVYNNAFGNIKQFDNVTPWMRLADGEPYRAFATPEQGLAYAVQKIKRRWPGPWAKLLRGDVSWYGDLGRQQYYESDPDQAQVEYNSILRTVRRLLA